MTNSINSVLSQIRSFQAQVGQPTQSTGDVARGNAIDVLRGPRDVGQAARTGAPSFTETLRNAIDGVNEAQQRSGALAQAFERGEPGADLAKVMIAAQQSQVAFRATVEVRNRLVQAYQDVLNMPL